MALPDRPQQRGQVGPGDLRRSRREDDQEEDEEEEKEGSAGRKASAGRHSSEPTYGTYTTVFSITFFSDAAPRPRSSMRDSNSSWRAAASCTWETVMPNRPPPGATVAGIARSTSARTSA